MRSEPIHSAPYRRKAGTPLGWPGWTLVVALSLSTGLARGAEQRTVEVLDMLRALNVAPNTRSIATRQGYVLQDLQTGLPDAKARPGDQVTALVALGSFDGKLAPTQWIIRLQLAEATAADSEKTRSKDVTQYTSMGDSFTFHSDVSRMTLETLGPIAKATSPDETLKVKHRGIQVSRDFLGLNLSRTAKVILKMKQPPAALAGIKVRLSANSRPFPAEEIAADRKNLTALELTPEDLRSFAGSLLALGQFLDIVRSTPDLQGILLQVLDKPSVFDVIRHGSSNSLHFSFLGGGPSNGAELFWSDRKPEEFSVLLFNLEIFQKPALTVVLFVTTPTPPLQVSAGIVGIFAWSPGKPDKLVGVRVLSSSAGTPPPDP